LFWDRLSQPRTQQAQRRNDHDLASFPRRVFETPKSLVSKRSAVVPKLTLCETNYNINGMKAKQRQRFDAGVSVRVKNPGVNGVVTQLDSSPTGMGEYWHTIRTEHGERREPGCNIELVPDPLTNMGPMRTPTPAPDEPLLLPEQAIAMLRAQVEEPVETLRYGHSDVEAWERIALRIVERAFGEHTRNANHFVCSVSHAHHTEEEAQEAHVQHIASKKSLLRAFIKELEIIPPHRPQVDVTKHGVFFAGQTFDELSAAARVLAIAKTRLMLIDGYLGADTLSLLPTTGIALDILTKPPISPKVKTLCQVFKAQHRSLAVKTSSAFHDRFVVIDDSAVYHFGASIKDLGKKTFMFSLIEEPGIVAELHAKIAAEWRVAVVEV
jgi:hypothetical protein